MSARSGSWIDIVRPSRRPRRGRLRMRCFLNSIIDLRHPEERSIGARLEGRAAVVPALIGRVLILFLIVLTLAGCGKKGAPQPPPDEPNTYPRTYPSG